MEELKTYFNNLGGGEIPSPHPIDEAVAESELPSHTQKDAAHLSISNGTDMINLAISQGDFIINVFIPFLEQLTWHSKKEKDFQD
jgi:hypothetical protein